MVPPTKDQRADSDRNGLMNKQINNKYTKIELEKKSYVFKCKE